MQTRATRAQQEQNAAALEQLTRALDELRHESTESPPASEETQRPLLKTLVDLYDALALAEREVRRSRENLLPSLEKLAGPDAEGQPVPPRLSWWSRWFAGSATTSPDQERTAQAREAAERTRQLLESLLTGYTMSLQRLDRALRQHGLEPITTTGQPFDPERMEVLEAVADRNRTPGAVVEEVRRGYLWNGRVFRYAQVRVAKP